MRGPRRGTVVFVAALATAVVGQPPASAEPSAPPVTPGTAAPGGTAPPAGAPPSAPPTVPTTDPFATPATPPPAVSEHANPAGEDDPGFFDVGGRVRQAINDWFEALVDDALAPVLDLLGRTILSTPDFTGPGRVRDLWLVSWGIANTAFVLFIVAAGVVGMGYETFHTRCAVKDLLPRLVFAWVSSNASLLLAQLAIGLANALSRAFIDQGVSGEGATATMGQLVAAAIASGGVFVTLIAIAVVVLALGLIGVYFLRVATMVVLVAAAPLFLAAGALPQTEGAARLWWRALVGCLGVQVGQALVLITAVRVFFDADGRRLMGLPGGPLMDLVVVGCLFWLMLRIPTYARRLVFNTRPDVAITLARTYVVSRGVRAAKAARAAAVL